MLSPNGYTLQSVWTMFPLCSYAVQPMWTAAEDLCFCVKMGLRKGLARVRGIRRALSDDEQNTVAREIIEHLELSNWKIEAGPPLRGHGPGLMPKE
jgi:hypothetical protein